MPAHADAHAGPRAGGGAAVRPLPRRAVLHAAPLTGPSGGDPRRATRPLQRGSLRRPSQAPPEGIPAPPLPRVPRIPLSPYPALIFPVASDNIIYIYIERENERK